VYHAILAIARCALTKFSALLQQGGHEPFGRTSEGRPDEVLPTPLGDLGWRQHDAAALGFDELRSREHLDQDDAGDEPADVGAERHATAA